MPTLILSTSRYALIVCLLALWLSVPSEARGALPLPPSPYENSLGMRFVYLPPGEFVMGSPQDEVGRDNDERQHLVRLSRGFYLQETEVTQGQWKRVMGENPSFFQNCGENCPVEQVSWHDAQRFIDALNRREGTTGYRLPTESQWEYGARAGTKGAFSSGGITQESCCVDPALEDAAWYVGNSERTPRPVAGKEPNPWGLYDMHGNVWEWCIDWEKPYPVGEAIDPTGPPEGYSKIRRGGAWNSYARFSRSAFRGSSEPSLRTPTVGFRVAFDPEAPALETGQERPAPAEDKLVAQEPTTPALILFGLDSTRLWPEMETVLDFIAEATAHSGKRLILEGRACDLGSTAYNDELSRRRAEVVKDGLVLRGVAAERIETRAFGERDPIAEPGKGTRERNRSVRILFDR